MRSTILLFVIALAAVGLGIYIFLTAGTRAVPAPQASSQAAGVTVAYATLASGEQSTVTERVNYVIHSSIELRRLWQMLHTNTPLPSVDFSNSDVLAIFGGTEPTTGYAVGVSGVADSTSRLVTVTVTAPGGSCITAQHVTSPFQIVEVPHTELPMTHADVAQTTNCLQ